MSSGVTVHRDVESEGFGDLSHGEVGLLCLDKGIPGPHRSPQYDGKEIPSCFVSS